MCECSSHALRHCVHQSTPQVTASKVDNVSHVLVFSLYVGCYPALLGRYASLLRLAVDGVKTTFVSVVCGCYHHSHVLPLGVDNNLGGGGGRRGYKREREEFKRIEIKK